MTCGDYLKSQTTLLTRRNNAIINKLDLVTVMR